MPNRQQSGYEYNSSRNTRVFVREMIVKDNLFLGDNCNLVYGLNSQVSFSKTMATEEAQIGLTDASGNPTSYVTTTTMEDYIGQQIDYQLQQLKLELPESYRLVDDHITMSTNRSIRWRVDNDKIDVMFLDSVNKNFFFQYNKPMYFRNTEKILMGVGNLQDSVNNQFEINSDKVIIDKLKIVDSMTVDQISGNTSDSGLLVENLSVINNTIYSITPSSNEDDTSGSGSETGSDQIKFYSYSPYRLIKRYVYSLITSDNTQMYHQGRKDYYLDLDGGIADSNGVLSKLRSMINIQEQVFVTFTVNLNISMVDSVNDTILVSIINHRRSLPTITDPSSNTVSWNSDTSENRLALLRRPVSEGGFGIPVLDTEDNPIVTYICNNNTDNFQAIHLEWLRSHGIGDVLIKESRLKLDSQSSQMSFTITYPMSSTLHYDSSLFHVKLETINDYQFYLRGHQNSMSITNSAGNGYIDINNRALSSGGNYQNIQVDLWVGHNSRHRDGSVISYHNLSGVNNDKFVQITDPLAS